MLSEEKSRQIEMAGTDRACMMLVCINGNENNVPYGIIVNYHLPRPVSFKGIHGLILALDEVCEMGNPINYSAGMAEDQKDRYIQYLAEQNQDLRLTGCLSISYSSICS